MSITTLVLGVTLMTDSALPAPLPTLTDKTLVAWVTVADLNSRGGSVLTIDDRQGHFDGIIFGEITPGKWMAGSDMFRRTSQQQADWPAETAGPETLVQIAIAYEGKTVTVYREGELYSRHEVAEAQTFPPSSAAVFGLRHIGAGQPCYYAGSVDDARLYSVALTQDQIRALRANTPSDPQPAAWWDFEDGTPTDRMGTFPEGRLVGNAEIRDGRLHLDGTESFLVAPGNAVPLPAATVPEYASPIHYRPFRGVFADPIPFFWQDEYHVFYLQGGVGKVPWKHIVSTDLVHWKELPDALVSDGDPNGPDGEHMFTGSVTESEGTFHIFYTGWNPRNPGGQECVMHATSPDLITWTKHPEAVIRPDGAIYKNHQAADWRDPYVFYNEEEQQWWMVMCSNTLQGEGGVGLLTSPDLWRWKHEPPLKADMQECPDLFRIGDTWYLIGGDHYSSSKSARGPYGKPPDYHFIDRPGVYAGKRQFDGKRHIWTGWAWDIPSHRDGEPGTWGGSQCVPRELYPGPAGRLYCKPVAEALAVFEHTALSLDALPPVEGRGGWRLEEGALISAPAACAFEAPEHYLLEADVRLAAGATFAVAMRQQESGEGYRLRLDTVPGGGDGTATLSGPGFTYVRKWPFDPARPVKLQVFVQGSLIEAFINDAVAMTCRAYDHQGGKLGFEAGGGGARIEGLSVKTAPERPRHYSAAGMYHWDTWYVPVGEEVHMFHLQVRRDNTRPLKDEGSIGHAVSRDLIRWTELPVALRKGPAGTYDDSWSLFTGCALHEGGQYLLYYCGNHMVGDRNRQSMCLATSEDGLRFERHPDNPIIEPDPTVYYSIHEPPPSFEHFARPHIDCRDLAIVKDPEGEGWLGYVVMRRKGQPDAFQSACVALCRSRDLMHWEVGPPCCAPGRFNCFEVPDVFELRGKWYMIALTGDTYQQSGRWADPNMTCATVVFQSDTPEGPFVEVRDNLLLGSTGFEGFSARTVAWKGERMMFYTRAEQPGRGRLAWPLRLAPREGGGLLPMYWSEVDALFGPPRLLPDTEVALGVQPLPTAGLLGNLYMVEATVDLGAAGRAGLTFGLSTERGKGFAVLLDRAGGPDGQVSLVTTPGLDPIQNRWWPVAKEGPRRLRLIVVDEMLEVYVDDVLVLNRYAPELRAGPLGVLAEGEAAKVAEVRVREGR